MKQTKEQVDYGKGMKTRHCGICVHYQKGGYCFKVRGDIHPECWCKLFAKK
jgi:hypothetical protein